MSRSEGNDAPQQPVSSERPQFGLRTLFVLVAIAALGALFWRSVVDPVYRQQQTMDLVRKLGGRIETAAGGWVVDLVDCNDPAAYIGHLATRPEIEALAVGGPAFTDEHLGRLHGLARLRLLVLDGTAVSQNAMTAFKQKLPEVEFYRSQRQTLAALKGSGIYVPTRTGPTSGVPLNQEYFVEAHEALLVDRITDASLEHVANLTTIELLSLRGAPVTDLGLIHLGRMTNLYYLSLQGTQITDAGLTHLHQLTRLRILNVSQTQVTEAGVERLRRALPDCGISRD